MLTPGYSLTPPPRLLDDFPGAAAAYSLRKLRSGYSGACIRVRRSSDNAEQDIGFSGSPPTLDETALLNFVGSGDGFVTRWYGQSQTVLDDASQTTENLQPKIVDQGLLITKSGDTAVDFTPRQHLVVSLGQVFSALTLYIRIFFDNWGDEKDLNEWNAPIDWFSNTNKHQFSITATEDNNGDLGIKPKNTLIKVDADVNYPGTWVRVGGTYNGSEIESYENGSAVNSNPHSRDPDGNVRLKIGHRNRSNVGLNGGMTHVLIWPSDEGSNLAGIDNQIA